MKVRFAEASIVDLFVIIMMSDSINMRVIFCRRELRFPTISLLRRDSEIAPTKYMYPYLQSSP